ncbi:hypothetical protein SPRG_05407 [Saprolegnia parasitica CBS 223.65]|uniref:Uncharacterized protein n=1 Tax=Saprolegnia parasitica (strain CBS 223.65) TaxID=695850 RepID=A0A067CF99_SAPPC|nr:hypothetical protein SPRG_05407 [Saprolegnia parasitica CBS 223.65]KDO29163.1 hypothetical protein SPRG_05407 [Saprolegnia parasitica CBS 223.65]|eukprot:XP_012200042.1 hypothetical protein SPRG_05407 [Saprolegnia parasitica CBS 223.65]
MSDRSGGARRSDPKHKTYDRARSAPVPGRKPSSYGRQAHPQNAPAHARKKPARERKVPRTPLAQGWKPPSRAHTPPGHAHVAKPKRDKYGDIEPAPPTPAEQKLMDRILYDRNDWKQAYLAAYMARNFLNGASSLGDPSPSAMATKLEDWLGLYLTRTFPLVRAMSKLLKESTRAADYDRHIHLVFTMAAKIAAAYVDEVGDARGLSEETLRVPRLLANCALKELADSHCLKHRLPGGINTMRHTILGRKALDVDMATERGRLSLYAACLGEGALDAATRESFGPLIATALSQRAAGVRVVASFTSYMHVAQDMPRDGRFVALTVCRHKPPVDGAKDIEVEFEESLAGLFHEGTLVSFEFHGLSSGQWYAVSPGRIYPSFYCPCRRVSSGLRRSSPRRRKAPRELSRVVASVGAAFSSDDENEETKAPPPAAAPKGILDIARKIQSPASLLLLQDVCNDRPPARSAVMDLLADAIPSTLVSADVPRKRSRSHGSSMAQRVLKMSRVEVLDDYGSDSEPSSTIDVGRSGHMSPASNDEAEWRQAAPLSPASSIMSTSSSRIDEHYDDGIGWNMDLASDDDAPSLGPMLGSDYGTTERAFVHPLEDGVSTNVAGNDCGRERTDDTQVDLPRDPLTTNVTSLVVGQNEDDDEALRSAALTTSGLEKVLAEGAARTAVVVDAHDGMRAPPHQDDIHRAPEPLDDEEAVSQTSASVDAKMPSTTMGVDHHPMSSPTRAANDASEGLPDVQESASTDIIAPVEVDKAPIEAATIDDGTGTPDVAAANALCVPGSNNKVVTCADEPTPTPVVPVISDAVDPERAAALTQDVNAAVAQATLVHDPITADGISRRDAATPLLGDADVLVPEKNSKHNSVPVVDLDTCDGGHHRQAADVTSAVSEDDASETEEIFVEVFEVEDSDDDMVVDENDATANARGDEEDDVNDEFVEVFEILDDDDDDDDELLQDASNNGHDVNTESASQLLAVTHDASVDALPSAATGGGTPADVVQGDDALDVGDVDGDDALDVSDVGGDDGKLAAPLNAVEDSVASVEVAPYHHTIEIDDSDDDDNEPAHAARATPQPNPHQVDAHDEQDDDASVVIEASSNMAAPVPIQIADGAPSSLLHRVDEARDEQPLDLVEDIDDAAVSSHNDRHDQVSAEAIDVLVTPANDAPRPTETSPSPPGVELPLDASLPGGNSFLTPPSRDIVGPPPRSPPPPPLPFLPPPGIDVGATYAASSDDYNSISSSSSSSSSSDEAPPPPPDEAPPPPPDEAPPLSPPRDMACVVRVKLPTAIKRQMIVAPKRPRPQPIYHSDMFESSASSPDDASDYEEGDDSGPRPKNAHGSASIPPSTVSSSDSSSDASSEDDEGSDEDEL